MSRPPLQPLGRAESPAGATDPASRQQAAVRSGEAEAAELRPRDLEVTEAGRR